MRRKAWLLTLVLGLMLVASPAMAASGKWYSGITLGLGYVALPPMTIDGTDLDILVTDAFGDHYVFSLPRSGYQSSDSHVGVELFVPIAKGPLVVGISSLGFGDTVSIGSLAVGVQTGNLAVLPFVSYYVNDYRRTIEIGKVIPAWPGDPGMGFNVEGGDMAWVEPGETVNARVSGKVSGTTFGLRVTYRLTDHIQLVGQWTKLRPATINLDIRFGGGGVDFTSSTVTSGRVGPISSDGGTISYVGLSYVF